MVSVVATTIVAPSRPEGEGRKGGMTATVLPTERLDVYEDPYAILEGLQDAWRARQNNPQLSRDDASDINTNEIEWRSYAPPAALKDVQGIDSDLLREIFVASVDNLQARAVEELKQEEEAAEEQRAADELVAKEAEKGKAPYLPIIIAEDKPPAEVLPDVDPNHPLSAGATTEDLYSDDGVTPFDPSQLYTKRRHKFMGIFRKQISRTIVIPESSKAGAEREAREAREAQEAQRAYFETKLQKVDIKSADPALQEKIAVLHRNTSFRVPEQPQLVECVSCLDDFAVKETIKVPCHSYCKDCFVRLITAACQHEQQWPAKCCLNEIPFRLILKNIPADLKETFEQRQSEWSTPIAERVYCNDANCDLWVKPKQIDQAKKIGTCDRGHLTCSLCRGAPHGKKDCPSDLGMNQTLQLAEEEGWKRCGKCKALVEHKEACQHMTCIMCKYEFCYVCSRVWRSCRCTMAQLDEIKAQARERRVLREARQQRENEELREVLAQIEAFERQEAERAEQERQEQIRIQEALWEKMLIERIRRETERRMQVEEKFNMLRGEMSSLHGVQKAAVAVDHDVLLTCASSEAIEKVKKLEEEHNTERAMIESRISGKVAIRDEQMEKEYAVRLVHEKKNEEEYELALKEYWADKENGEEEMATALKAYQRQMDNFHDEWQTWRSTESSAYRSKLLDETSIREELMYSALHRLQAKNEEEEISLAHRLVAERKWVQQAFAERERLLNAAEVAEMDGDADSLFTPENRERAAAAEHEVTIDEGPHAL